jgi:hypothetical protein
MHRDARGRSSMTDTRPKCPNHHVPMRPLRGSSFSYMDEDLDEPGVGKFFPNSIERRLFLNYTCPRGDTSASVEVKRAVYSNPQITDMITADDQELSASLLAAEY